jgi:tetratricopeptide (TPR) repeat protein
MPTILLLIHKKQRIQLYFSKKLIWLLGFIICTISSQAGNFTFEKANELYHNSRHAEAADLYQQMINENVVNEDVYYNAGNAFYRINKYGMAVWCYTKALQYKPGDAVIKENLTLSRQKLGSKYVKEDTWAFIEKAKKLLDYNSLNKWCWLSLGWFCFAALLTSIQKLKVLPAILIGIRKLVWFICFLHFICMIASYIVQRVIKQGIVVEATPQYTAANDNNSAIKQNIIGTHVWILQYISANVIHKGRYKIQLPDGSRKWIDASAVRKL